MTFPHPFSFQQLTVSVRELNLFAVKLLKEIPFPFLLSFFFFLNRVGSSLLYHEFHIVECICNGRQV